MDSDPLSRMRDLAELPTIPVPPSLEAWGVLIGFCGLVGAIAVLIRKRAFRRRPRIQLITEAVSHFEFIRGSVESFPPRDSARRMVVELRRLLSVLEDPRFGSSSGNALREAVEPLPGPQRELGVALLELDRVSYSPGWSTEQVRALLSRVDASLRELLRAEEMRRKR